MNSEELPARPVSKLFGRHLTPVEMEAVGGASLTYTTSTTTTMSVKTLPRLANVITVESETETTFD